MLSNHYKWHYLQTFPNAFMQIKKLETVDYASCDDYDFQLRLLRSFLALQDASQTVLYTGLSFLAVQINRLPG